MKSGTDPVKSTLPYRSHASYLKERFGERVHRVSLDAGFGCPHRRGGRGPGGCIYCSAHGSGSGAHDRGQTIRAQMQAGIERLSRSGIHKTIAYFQAFCGTGADPEELRRLYREAVTFPGVVGLSVGTRPDMLPDEVLELLARFARGRETGSPLDVWVELGLQSANDDTLRRIHRGHDAACFDDAAARADRHGISVAAHVILGLPGEEEGRMMETARYLGTRPVKGVKLHHLYVEEGTELAKQYADRSVVTLSRSAYVDLAIAFIRRLPPKVVLLRLCGRGDPKILIAPCWGLDPGSIASRIRQEMVERGVKQGDLHSSQT